MSYGDKREDPTWIACDTVVLCAGQVPLFSLAQELEAAGRKPHRIGGALEAGELDAKRAIDQAARLAARL
ncbi:2,4-dienoyl-CoA reductase [NADPH] [compost metagenome]